MGYAVNCAVGCGVKAGVPVDGIGIFTRYCTAMQWEIMPVIIRICCVVGIAKIADILNPVHCGWRGAIAAFCGLVVVGLRLRLCKVCFDWVLERGRW